MTGLASVPPPSAGTLLGGWVLDPAAAVLLVLAAGFYVAGVRRLRRSGGHWPWVRSAAFAAGCATVGVALLSGLARYEQALFTAHAVQHVLLGIVAPPLLALGAPVTLALRAGGPDLRAGLRVLLRARVARWIARPMVAWVLYVTGPAALYFTSVYELSLRNGLVHLGVHAHLFLTGCLFAWVVLGVDPVPHRPGHGARLLLAALALPPHALTGVALLMSRRLIAPGADRPVWLVDPLADQRAGGGLLWAAGELVSVLVLGAVVLQWMRAEERAAAREDRAAAAGA